MTLPIRTNGKPSLPAEEPVRRGIAGGSKGIASTVPAAVGPKHFETDSRNLMSRKAPLEYEYRCAEYEYE